MVAIFDICAYAYSSVIDEHNDMVKKYVRKETLTVSRQQELHVLDEMLQDSTSKYHHLKMVLEGLYRWLLANVINLKKDTLGGEINS